MNHTLIDSDNATETDIWQCQCALLTLILSHVRQDITITGAVTANCTTASILVDTDTVTYTVRQNVPGSETHSKSTTGANPGLTL